MLEQSHFVRMYIGCTMKFQHIDTYDRLPLSWPLFVIQLFSLSEHKKHIPFLLPSTNQEERL